MGCPYFRPKYVSNSCRCPGLDSLMHSNDLAQLTRLWRDSGRTSYSASRERLLRDNSGVSQGFPRGSFCLCCAQAKETYILSPLAAFTCFPYGDPCTPSCFDSRAVTRVSLRARDFFHLNGHKDALPVRVSRSVVLTRPWLSGLLYLHIAFQLGLLANEECKGKLTWTQTKPGTILLRIAVLRWKINAHSFVPPLRSKDLKNFSLALLKDTEGLSGDDHFFFSDRIVGKVQKSGNQAFALESFQEWPEAASFSPLPKNLFQPLFDLRMAHRRPSNRDPATDLVAWPTAAHAILTQPMRNIKINCKMLGLNQVTGSGRSDNSNELTWILVPLNSMSRLKLLLRMLALSSSINPTSPRSHHHQDP
ncbi:hypothetical protein VNO77_03484 [Canavalia gladiata]|uniref:Uncharacterized protein n=1 Tax=Canavalia gladiata TaxID=3824 RepID=A0AAN9MZT4_CANGL